MSNVPAAVFVQRRRSILIPAIAVAFSLLLATGLMFYVPVGSKGWLSCVLCIAIDLFVIAVLTIQARGLSRPMLTLHERYLIYRKTAIPWSRVLSVSPLQLGSRQLVGIAISEAGQEIVYLTKRQSVRQLLLKNNQRVLAKFGLLIVPPAVGLSVEQLCERVRDFQKDRLVSQ